MPDPGTILATITQSLGVIRIIQDLLKTEKPDVVTLRTQIQALREQLLDAKENVLSFQEDNLNFKTLNATLNQRIPELTSEPPEHAHGAHWFVNDGPFCTGCWDSGQKRIRLVMVNSDGYKLLGGNCTCPMCKTVFTVDAKRFP